jgi:putative tryptophan/tyrosine transport system substrate-binding protein
VTPQSPALARRPAYGPPIDRRRFLLTSLAGALAAPLVVEAQRAAGRRPIGYLSSNSASLTQHLVAAFRQGLRELGYVEGQNITDQSFI